MLSTLIKGKVLRSNLDSVRETPRAGALQEIARGRRQAGDLAGATRTRTDLARPDDCQRGQLDPSLEAQAIDAKLHPAAIDRIVGEGSGCRVDSRPPRRLRPPPVDHAGRDGDYLAELRLQFKLKRNFIKLLGS